MDPTPLGEPPWSSAHRPFACLPQPGRSNRPSFLDEPTSLVEPTSQRGPKPPKQHLQADATCRDLRISFYARRNHQELPPLPQSQPHQQAMQHETRSSQPFRCLSCYLGLEHHPSQQCRRYILAASPARTACATLPFSAPSQNPSHQSQQPSDGATLEQSLDAWVQKVEVKVQEWLAPLQAQVRSFATELEKVQRSQPHTQPETALSGLAAQPALSCSPPLPSSLPNPGKWSLLRLFPWVSSEIADIISLDHLAIVDLIKLHNPASSTVSEETPTMLTV